MRYHVHAGNAHDKGGEKLWGDRGDIGAKQAELNKVGLVEQEGREKVV